MWSATWPPEVKSLASSFLHTPVTVQANNAATLTANAAIEQHFELCAEGDKHGRLLQLLRGAHEADPAGAKGIVFCASKRGCEHLRTDLRRRGFAAESLHGDKSQQERDWSLLQFRQGHASLLIATDVASRGLDVKDVKTVYNFDAPQQVEDYVHRIGRAGRAGASGESFTLITPADAPFASDVTRMLRRSEQPVPRVLQPFVRVGGPGGPEHSSGANRRWR
jgi:ATP-dependent RNA helicase DDX5/DBP2